MATKQAGARGAMAEPDWDLGDPATANSLWVDVPGGIGAVRTAYRTQRVVPGGDIDADPTDAKRPYEGVQLVTVLLDQGGPKLLVDGVQLTPNAADDMVLPPPQVVAGSRGVFAPLVFSTLVVGTGVPPAEVRVALEQGVGGRYETLETATVNAATDVDAEADCYLFPYPVRQELLFVRAAWEDSRGERRGIVQTNTYFNTDDGRDLGFLGSALARLRAVYDDMVPEVDANRNFKPPRRPATASYIKMASLHRAVLAYTWQGTAFTAGTAFEGQAGRINPDGDFGPGNRTRLKSTPAPPAAAAATPPGAGPTQPQYRLLEFYPKRVDTRIVVRVGELAQWTLVSDDIRSINALFQFRRGRVSELLDATSGPNSIQARARAVRVSTGADRGTEDAYSALPPIAAGALNPLTYMREQIISELGGSNPDAPNRRYDAQAPNGAALRIWGPPLLRRPTQQVVLDRDVIGNEPEEAKEARVGMREAIRLLTRDYEEVVRKNRGPLRNVAWYSALPPSVAVPANQFATWTVRVADRKVPRNASELSARANVFATSGVMPLAASTCIGGFLPSDSVTESQARARLGGGEKQVDALSRLGLRHTPEAMAAMIAFADLIVHECMRPGAPTRPLDDPIDSSVRRAQRHALAAAKLLRNMYAATERTARLFLRETDPLFVTAPGGRAALVCMRHLPCWAIAIARDVADGNRTADDATDRPLWSKSCRESASAFAEALRRLGQLDRSPVHPVALPLLPLQALWTWPPTSSVAVTHGTPLLERQRQLTSNAAALTGYPGATATHMQVHAARLSVARTALLGRLLQLPNAAAARVLRAVVYARPAAVRAEEAPGLLQFVDPALVPTAELDELIAAASAGAVREPPATSVSAMRKVWARRALDTYSRWRHEDVQANQEDDLGTALAKLSLVQPTDADPVQTYYAPFGISANASPLAGVNPGVGEARVWTRFTAWDPLLGDVPAGTRELRLVPKRCTPYDGVLIDAARRDAHVHPHLFVLDHSADPPTLVVPTNLDVLEGGGVDALRSIMFTAERLYQALQCAAVYGATLVTIVDPPGTANAFSGALSLALGLLPNVVPRSFSLRFVNDTAALQAARTLFNRLLQTLNNTQRLHAVALCEASVVVAGLVY